VRSRLFHPLGFPLVLRTNSAEAEAAVCESWGSGRPRSASPELELRIQVKAGAAAEGTPEFRTEAARFTVACGGDAGTADLARGRASLAVSRATVADSARFRWFFADALVCTMLVQRALTPLHAACVARNGIGVLLCGPSGSGKSTLALACALRGWDLVAEDASYAVNEDQSGEVRGRTGSVRLRPQAAAYFPALAGRRATRHPNGKPTIEIVPSEIGQVRTAHAARIAAVMRLRRGAAEPGCRRADPAALTGELLAAIPHFSAAVRERHERTIAALAARGAWDLCYGAPDEGVALLDRFLEAMRD